MAYAAARAPLPYELVAGKSFTWSWEIAPAEDGPAASLAGIAAAAVTIKPKLGTRTTVAWALGSRLAISTDQLSLTLTLAPGDTSPLAPGPYDLQVSLGAVAGTADDVLLIGSLNVIAGL